MKLADLAAKYLGCPVEEPSRSGMNSAAEDIPPVPHSKAVKADLSGPFERAFIDVMNELKEIQSKENIDGWVSYIEQYHPDLDKKANEVEDKFNVIWQEGLQGKPLMKEFTAALRDWRELKLEAIEIYKKENPRPRDTTFVSPSKK